MDRNVLGGWLGRLAPVALIVLAAGSPGCVAVSHRSGGATAAPAASSAARVDDKAEAKEKAAEVAEQEAEHAREIAKLERELVIAEMRLAKTRMEGEHAELARQVNLARLERELVLERERQRIFEEREVPARIQRAELGIQRSEDNLREAQEEMQQLELMYGADDFADQTKEIVLDRGRRELERTQRDLEIDRQEHATLLDRTIPLERAEHAAGVEEKEAALAKGQRDAEAEALGARIDVMAGESELARLRADMEAQQRKIERQREKRGQSSTEKE